MRKIMILMMAFLLPFSALEMRADDSNADFKIPLRVESSKKLGRNVCNDLITAHYLTSLSLVITVTEDLGDVEIVVTNTSTGEFWSDTFDSTAEHQSFLPISGTPGYYEIEYVTEAGGVYAGEFLIE